jgi:uncharacterized repeat protein (TIGR01451 family)
MSKKNVYFYIIIVCFAFISNCFAASDLPYKEGELLVRFAPKAKGVQRTVNERNQLLSSLDVGQIKHSYKRVQGLTLVKLPERQKVADVLAKFKNKGEILYIEPNYKIKLCSTTPNDPCFVYQWGMNNTGQNNGTADADIDAPEAWDITHDACDIIVAVTDTGVDYTHPDLAANMWVNQAELNGLPDFDDDGNGYKDDIYGWDFADNNNNPADYYPHGTHVAGIIGAHGNNGIGVAGVCWNVKIMNLKIFPSTEAFISDAIDAIEYAVDKGAKVINASWSIADYYSDGLKDAIDVADANGVLFIAAAGNFQYGTSWYDNDITPLYSANYDCNKIISVMATDNTDAIWYYSHYGETTVDLAAPGVSILSCLPDNDYQSESGTSMAAPHVAGACVLVWAMNPNLTHLQVKDAIMQSVDHLSSLNGKCVTGGRLNLYNTMMRIPHFNLTKTDDANSGGVYPGYQFNYTIDYNYPNIDPNWASDLHNVAITDILPAEVNFVSASGTYDYNSTTHTVTWDNIGTLSSGDGNSVTITVTVRDTLPPLTCSITNTAKIKADEAGEISVVRLTPWRKVWNVTQDEWYSAIQTAIDNANDGDLITVWPGHFYEHLTISNKSIKLLAVDPNAAHTIIDANNTTSPMKVVAYTNSQTSLISGFTITNGYYGVHVTSNASPHVENCILSNCVYGLYGSNSGTNCPDIVNCSIRNNSLDGIWVFDGSTTILGSIIENNSGKGIYSSGNLTVTTSLIRNNGGYGIELSGNSKTRTIKNSIVSGSTTGIYLGASCTSTSEVSGCTLYCSSSPYVVSMNYGSIPVKNCIVWGQNPFGGSSYNVKYSCVKYGYGLPSAHNISSDPCFVNLSGGDFHLLPASQCIDKGDPNSTVEPNEVDFDGDVRIWDGNDDSTAVIDMGADEFADSNADLNNDRLVNFSDYAIFSNAWGHTSSDPNWSSFSACDFIADNVIDNKDLRIFANDWLWCRNHRQFYLDTLHESMMTAMGIDGDFMMMGGQQQSSSSFQLEESYSMESQTPTIYLVYDGNMMPDPNDEITVQIHTDTPLLCMGLGIQLTGDAEIVTAMGEADCNSFGWDNGWNSDPYIDDVNNWAYVNGVRWDCDANDIVGYLTFIYHSGEVSVSFMSDYSSTYDANCQEALFSLDALVFGRDPNE